MPKNINWDGVIQSINDFWLPILGVGGIIVIVVIIAVIYIQFGHLIRENMCAYDFAKGQDKPWKFYCHNLPTSICSFVTNKEFRIVFPGMPVRNILSNMIYIIPALAFAYPASNMMNFLAVKKC